jgi:hypothetical protein
VGSAAGSERSLNETKDAKRPDGARPAGWTIEGAEEHMLISKKKGHRPPDQPFTHLDGCKIVRADPEVDDPPWSRHEHGRWERVCQCSKESWYEPPPKRVRLDALDPKTSRHLPECEFAHETDPVILRALLKIQDKETYAWVECGTCTSGWQVPFYVAESRGF